MGCRNRNLAAHLRSGFVMGKVTRGYYFKMSNLAYNGLFCVLNSCTYGEHIWLKICEKSAYINT